jgi:hypothetical protein
VGSRQKYPLREDKSIYKSMRIFHAYSITVINIPEKSYILGNTENINAIMTSRQCIPTMLERNMYPLLGDMG